MDATCAAKGTGALSCTDASVRVCGLAVGVRGGFDVVGGDGFGCAEQLRYGLALVGRVRWRGGCGGNRGR